MSTLRTALLRAKEFIEEECVEKFDGPLPGSFADEASDVVAEIDRALTMSDANANFAKLRRALEEVSTMADLVSGGDNFDDMLAFVKYTKDTALRAMGEEAA